MRTQTLSDGTERENGLSGVSVWKRCWDILMETENPCGGVKVNGVRICQLGHNWKIIQNFERHFERIYFVQNNGLFIDKSLLCAVHCIP